MRVQFLATAIAMLGIAAVPPVMAQAVEPPIQQSAPAISDAELKSFAVAVAGIQRVNDIYLPKLQTARTDEEREQVQKIASMEMKRAVENEGITVTRFQEILEQARSNPEVAERVRRHIQQPQ
jgi:Domain of unknown function (DUF4168)